MTDTTDATRVIADLNQGECIEYLLLTPPERRAVLPLLTPQQQGKLRWLLMQGYTSEASDDANDPFLIAGDRRSESA